jgi:hypothetical protein
MTAIPPGFAIEPGREAIARYTWELEVDFLSRTV